MSDADASGPTVAEFEDRYSCWVSSLAWSVVGGLLSSRLSLRESESINSLISWGDCQFIVSLSEAARGTSGGIKR